MVMQPEDEERMSRGVPPDGTPEGIVEPGAVSATAKPVPAPEGDGVEALADGTTTSATDDSSVGLGNRDEALEADDER